MLNPILEILNYLYPQTTNNFCKMNKILEALKIKFEGFSAKQLEVKAKAMAKKGQTETDVESVTAESVIEAYADFRTNSATDKLKAEHAKAIEELGGKGEPTTSPTTGDKWSDGDDLNESEVIKEMRAQMKAQQDKLDAIEKSNATSAKAKLQSDRLSEIAQMVSILDEPLRAPYLIGNFADMDDETFTAHKATTQTSVDATAKYNKGAGSSYRAPQGGGGSTGEASKDELDKVFQD